jgi:phosphomannomutase/NDP-sugar pyrophosphorylase family protein
MKKLAKKNPYIGKHVKMADCIIDASSIVEGVVENSTIGKGCYIDKNSRIIHSTIGDYSQIYNSQLTCVHTGTLFESEDAKIISASFGQKNTVYGDIKNLLCAGDNNLFKKTSTLEGERNDVGSNTIIDGRIINSFIGDGTRIHHPGTVIENSCIAPHKEHAVDISDAWVKDSVVWGGSDISPGANIRPNSIIGPFVHIGTGGETKAAFIRGGSALNKVEAAHRNYLGNFLACVIRIDAPINSKAYYRELQEKTEALLYGTILDRKVNQLVEDPIQPEEELVIDYRGKEITVTIEGINLGALFTTSNFDPRNDGFKGITIVKSGAKAGICSGAQAPAVIEAKALIGSMSKTFGRQTGEGDIVVGGGTETVRKGAIISQRGRLGDRTSDNVEINLDGLRQLDALVNVSLTGLSKATEREKLAYAKEIEILKAQIEELAEWTLRLLKLTDISVSNLKKDLKGSKLPSSDIAQIKRRIKEQNNVLVQSDAITKEIEKIKKWVCKAYDYAKETHFRIHGTDGCRGNIYIEDNPVSYMDALKAALTEDKMLPEIFDLLAYSTIQALKLKGIDTGNVLVGQDTRDLYTGKKGKEGRFTQAVINGVRSAGSNVRDIGITPIPNASYMLAYLDYKGSPIRANVALVKTASHNPKHQDGLKVFYKADRGKYIKLMPDDEELVTNIMFKTAIEGKNSIPPTLPSPSRGEGWGGGVHKMGKYYDYSTKAVQVFKQFMLRGTERKAQFEIIDTIILDLSNGAVSTPPYKQVIDELLKACGIKNRFYVGDKPNGKNINEDDPAKGKVGAGHFEGVDVIKFEETRGGKWSNFPVLKKLFECGMAKASPHPIPPPRGGRGRVGVGKLVVAVLTDGDGDRGYIMVYNPWANNIKLIDGDHALYLQLWNALKNESITNGETIAFTVESSTGFINAITSLIKKHGFNVNLLEAYDDEPSKNAINIVITPVGDKYILFKQFLGAESTGHIVKKGVVLAGDGRTKNHVFTGNGVFGAIETLSSINDIYASHDGKPEELMKLVLNPYQHGNSQITYCYFVDKQLWERGNNIWKQAEAIINDSLKKAFARKRDIVIEPMTFDRETDTLYTHVLLKDKTTGDTNKFILTLHVRPSGTEDKIGVKIFGNNNKVITKLSEEISEKMFALFWKTMKNRTSKYAIREAEILRLLTKPLTIGKLKKTLTGNVTNLSFLIDAMGIKKQRLIKTEGSGNNTLLTLTGRGETLVANQRQNNPPHL